MDSSTPDSSQPSKKEENPPYAIVTDSDIGQQVIATRDLLPGDLILDEEEPVIKIPMWHDSGLNSHFATCLGCSFHIDLELNDYRCTGCGWPLCEDLCEEIPDHSDNECKIFSSQNFTFPPPSKSSSSENELSPWRMHQCILIIRAIALKSSNPTKFNQLMALQSSPSLPSSNNVLIQAQEKIQQEIDVLKKYFDFQKLEITDEDLTKIIWIYNINAFMSQDFDEFGQERYRVDCLYPIACRFNNSCSPNSSHSVLPKWPTFLMTIRTSQKVAKDEPLSILYNVEGIMSTLQRQKDLLHNFYFICKCQRCLDPTELGTYTSSFVCPNCAQNWNTEDLENIKLGYLLPINPLDVEDDSMKCNECNQVQQLSSLPPSCQPENVEQLGQLLRSGGQLSLEDVEQIIEFYRGTFLHDNHWLIQLAADRYLKIVDRVKYMDQQIYLANFHKYKKYALYRLSIENVLSPGISYFISRIQLDFCQIILAYAEETKTKPEELDDLIKMSSDMLKGALTYFEYFSKGTPHGEFILQALYHSRGRLNEIVNSSNDQKLQGLTLDEGK